MSKGAAETGVQETMLSVMLHRCVILGRPLSLFETQILSLSEKLDQPFPTLTINQNHLSGDNTQGPGNTKDS